MRLFIKGVEITVHLALHQDSGGSGGSGGPNSSGNHGTSDKRDPVDAGAVTIAIEDTVVWAEGKRGGRV